ncbi:MAG: leucyl/phenylalanyl-tRNA--protein transferase [Lentimicrobiaceae bacterium]|nr:leucyl/phenylalanyl-tRNA--protein transferase [Lentimicrobiaceae bacterium]
MEFKKIEFLDESSDDFPLTFSDEPNGLIAIGSNLKVSTLIKAYRHGLFPWFEKWSAIMWYSPMVRCIIPKGNFKTSKTLKQKIRRRIFDVTADQAFAQVIGQCANVKRDHQLDTWIDNRMTAAYTALYKAGYAHSIEVWSEGQLAGGLYGVSLGKAFFGESMFHLKSDASKVALYYLCNWLDDLGFHFVDAQVTTDHLISLGGIEITREEYIKQLHEALAFPDFTGRWTNEFKTYYAKQ